MEETEYSNSHYRSEGFRWWFWGIYKHTCVELTSGKWSRKHGRKLPLCTLQDSNVELVLLKHNMLIITVIILKQNRYFLLSQECEESHCWVLWAETQAGTWQSTRPFTFMPGLRLFCPQHQADLMLQHLTTHSTHTTLRQQVSIII